MGVADLLQASSHGARANYGCRELFRPRMDLHPDIKRRAAASPDRSFAAGAQFQLCSRVAVRDETDLDHNG